MGMKKNLIFLLVVIILNLNFAFAGTMQGGVEKEVMVGGNKIFDTQTNMPIAGAKVTLPLKNFMTVTDSQGRFSLNADINAPTILSVEKEGYKPFSLTVSKIAPDAPLIIGIEKSDAKQISIDTELYHLGDNSFSYNSANAADFQIRSIGPYYSKNFNLPKNTTKAALVIGSIIGLDTKMAKAMGQNKIVQAYASPTEVFFNGVKVAEIQLNGDGQRIKLPSNLIKAGRKNQITIKTGRNMMAYGQVDYDDIEIANLSIEVN